MLHIHHNSLTSPFIPNPTTTTTIMVFFVPPNHRKPPPSTITQQRLFLSLSLQLLQNNDSLLISDLGVGPYSTLTLHTPLLGRTQPPSAAKLRFDFLNSKPPSNYVAGLGRGGTGFTTRSNIGPSNAVPDSPDRSATTIGAAPTAPNVGVGRGKGGEDEEEDEGEDKGYDENHKFDEFEGNDVGLFASAEYVEKYDGFKVTVK
ncbi:putative PRP1 splicing factor, pre-mRNA-processing factor 6/Prp1/STA1 [Lupinus albus]|uniref:Putative PRP1 splicing factor, pre-mRNA-processing factor 6/Prp1/STA1 n=1 Tax=Lupinus albus TaxID=3870 RepID=A0A6A4NFH1_LUPAL|nr:putative PRP1 splicing factor, pre-mRNA-processing factor 6/Prp1/STA1 [Lupinus albus]